MESLQVIELAAGYDPDGNTIVERLQVRVNPDDSCQLVRSPAFVQGIASGDTIKLDRESGQFEIVRRSGMLSIRVISRNQLHAINQSLTPELEKLGGELDSETERMLVYSIHVSCGFANIEDLLNRHVTAREESLWRYGNVYDPTDGTTPLNWWVEILKEK